MSNVNQVNLSGRACADIESRQVGNSTVAVLRLASTRSFKDRNDEWKEQSTFIDCEAWGKLAESLLGNVTKGTPIFVSGRLATDEWEHEGKKRSKVKLVVNDYLLLTGKTASKDGNSEGEERTPAARQGGYRKNAKSNSGNLSEKAAELPF